MPSSVVKRTSPPPLWRCPKCGAKFVTRNLWHSCGKYNLKDLFRSSEPQVYRIFQKFARMVKSCGPVTMIPQKTRVVFMVRVRYAAAIPRKSYLECGFALPRTVKDQKFHKIEPISPHFVGHILHVTSEDQLDRQVQTWLKEAYTVGEQKQVLKKRNAVR